ncbi:DUF6376 family protein [Bacillus sp. NPDC077027]|uniref:DUF6376 family protein n=1 Tax=Bacillus sp. NPDC077027 TaxID=3390548 RepID=UPI003D06B6A6
MKKKVLVLVFSIWMVLSGCSDMLENVNDTATYATKATDYVNEVQTFTNEFPKLAEQAVSDATKKADLTKQLESLQTEISSFNELTAPKIAEDIHKQIEEKNERISTEINTYLQQVKEGTIDLAKLNEKNGLIDTLQQSISLINEIKNVTN